ncbi:MAG: hypothetical protein Q8O48_01955 [Anaerolineales bacterium]|nr:hypothetical protein [Anaerolineales bacterium]
MFQSFIDPLSFILGFVPASIFWLLVSRAQALWDEMRTGWAEQREAAYNTLWEIGASGVKPPHPSQFGFD